VASTGVIGPQIDVRKIGDSLPELVGSLRPDGWERAAHAIMTTDTVMKLSAAVVEIDGVPVTIGGIAKGAGMIAPNMATMLAFVCTDAAVEPNVLQEWTRIGADASFNRITVDGDTSTNDTLLVLASGKAGNREIDDLDSEAGSIFGQALQGVLLDLAQQCVEDAEGATKFVEVRVVGAATETDAREIAFTVAHSPLVKTAFFGEDANWGRVVAAAGRAGVELDPESFSLCFGDVCVFKNGTPITGSETEARASAVFKQKRIPIELDLGLGTAGFTVYTSDFSLDYVRINADYRS
jgi:glutamate N-acetyltransferase/amino-acid N-acetyltransferase